jgi:hypothetical protein
MAMIAMRISPDASVGQDAVAIIRQPIVTDSVGLFAGAAKKFTHEKPNGGLDSADESWQRGKKIASRSEYIRMFIERAVA